MSEIDDGEDLEFLRAFEDELYNDTSSDGRYETSLFFFTVAAIEALQKYLTKSFV